MKIVLGQGRLSWNAEERRTDRYGTVTLYDNDDEPISLKQVREGRKGCLIATVTEPKVSGHIGDMFRNIRQEHPPKKDDEVVLGIGKIFYMEDSRVGLEPVEKRDSDWLDPHQLYKVHDSIVVLCFNDAPVR